MAQMIGAGECFYLLLVPCNDVVGRLAASGPRGEREDAGL